MDENSLFTPRHDFFSLDAGALNNEVEVRSNIASWKDGGLFFIGSGLF
jgi:hypothetical protein